jgi:hypothetical protein
MLYNYSKICALELYLDLLHKQIKILKGTACFLKHKQLFLIPTLTFAWRHLVVKVLIYI